MELRDVHDLEAAPWRPSTALMMRYTWAQGLAFSIARYLATYSISLTVVFSISEAKMSMPTT